MATPREPLRWSRVAAALACSLLLLSLTPWSAMAKKGSDQCRGKPYIVKIHADWCGTCKMTESTWTRIRAELSTQATVVQFDVSDRVALQESQVEAERLGIADFFQEFRSRTGTIAILDCKTRRPVAVLTGVRDFDKYHKAVTKAGRAS
jgi:thiol-disulfide isomerase/thioredoxin